MPTAFLFDPKSKFLNQIDRPTAVVTLTVDRKNADRCSSIGSAWPVRAFCVFLFSALFVLTPHKPAFARYAALVMNAMTGEVLYQENADLPRYPASLTKIMTLYLLFDAIDAGRVSLDDRMPVSAHAAAQAPSKLGLSPGETISVENAILALVTKSANDVAVIVGEYIGGSEENFARRMTSTAHALGMDTTTFRNASGLPDGDQQTTARDMAILARAMLRTFPHYYHYFGTPAFRYEGITYANHNRMLGNYAGLDGMKTGFIRDSGFNLVASAKRGDTRLIGVVFGADSPAQRSNIMSGLLTDGFRDVDESLVAGVYATPSRPGAAMAVRGNSQPSTDSGVISNVWNVTLGNYPSQSSAQQAGVLAIRKASSYLGKGTVTTNARSLRGGKRSYVAQVEGLTRDQAYAGCRALKSQKGSCAVVNASASSQKSQQSRTADRGKKSKARTVADNKGEAKATKVASSAGKAGKQKIKRKNTPSVIASKTKTTASKSKARNRRVVNKSRVNTNSRKRAESVRTKSHTKKVKPSSREASSKKARNPA